MYYCSVSISFKRTPGKAMKRSNLFRFSGLKWVKNQWDGLPVWLRWLSPYMALASLTAFFFLISYIEIKSSRNIIILSGTRNGSAYSMGEALKSVLNNYTNPAGRSVLSGEYWKRTLLFDNQETMGTKQ